MSFAILYRFLVTIPDPQYKEYIIAAIERLKKANELIAKKHGSDVVLIAKENLQLRKDYDELKVKYAKVLGMNQKLQEKRLIKL